MSNPSSHSGNARVAKAERLFRSAITAYCSLIRPSREDAARLDDLTLPLLPLVSPEGRRYAAAALSEAGTRSTALGRRLADEPLEISAPMLIRSAALSDVDLIGLIGRHGIGHARAIGRRARLNSNIGRLIKALGAAEDMAQSEAPPMQTAQPRAAEPATAYEPKVTDRPRETAAEEVRTQLREMMRPAQPAQFSSPAVPALDWDKAATSYPKLLSAALTHTEAFFHTALADALDVRIGSARMLGDGDAPSLATVLKAFDLAVEQAFLVVALVYPYGVVEHENIRGFVTGFRALDVAKARDEVTAWRRLEAQRRTSLVRDWLPDTTAEPANDTGTLEALRAS